MSNVNMEGLPPEMQQRIAGIIEKAKAQTATAPEQTAAPAERPVALPAASTLSDGSHHCSPSGSNGTGVRNLQSQNEQVAAMGQVVEAVGQAVGQLYADVLPANRNYRYKPNVCVAVPTTTGDWGG